MTAHTKVRLLIVALAALNFAVFVDKYVASAVDPILKAFGG